jgi:hypothetical protein
VPLSRQRIDHLQRVLLIVAGHGLEHRHGGWRQVACRNLAPVPSGPGPGPRRPEKLPYAIQCRHDLEAQQQPQYGIQRRPQQPT